MQREVEAHQSFLILITEDEAYVQVVGLKKLEFIKRAKISKNILEPMFDTYKNPTRGLGELDPVFHNLMKDVLDEIPSNVITVPILTPESSSM